MIKFLLRKNVFNRISRQRRSLSLVVFLVRHFFLWSPTKSYYTTTKILIRSFIGLLYITYSFWFVFFFCFLFLFYDTQSRNTFVISLIFNNTLYFSFKNLISFSFPDVRFRTCAILSRYLIKVLIYFTECLSSVYWKFRVSFNGFFYSSS